METTTPTIWNQGFSYIAQHAKREGITSAEFITKHGAPAMYRDFYPDGFSACITDQDCRGNPNARLACLRLMEGDSTMIKREAGMKTGVLWMGKCGKVFKDTKLGPEMQSTSVKGPVLVAAVKGNTWKEKTGPQGGTKVIDKSPLISRVKMPTMPEFKFPNFGISTKFKVVGTFLILFGVIFLGLIAIGYSGLGGSAGRVAEREHKRSR
jgi:hypothetical protein